MFEKPKPSELHKSCEWNGATWWYCGKETGGKCNGVYPCHKPKSCRGKAHKETKTNDKDHSKKVVIQEALNTTCCIDDGYESH